MAEHAHNGHASVDDQYLETPPGSSYERTDANVWLIAKFLGWLIVSAVIIHFGLGFLYALLIEQATETGEQRYPLAAVQEQRLPPMPRLQQDPPDELNQFRVSEDALLHNYGWMNRNAGIVHIPVAEAMRLTVERGLPTRAVDPVQPPPATPGMMASDASAGRTMERRRQ